MRSIFICLLSLLPLTLYAQTSESIRTGRPGMSIGANVVGTGVLQWQTGVEYNRTETTSEDVAWINNNVIRYGLDEKFELSTVFDYRDQDSIGSGMDNLQLGGRINLIPEASSLIPTLGLQARYRFKGSGKYKKAEGRPQILISSVFDLKSLGSLTFNGGLGYDGNSPGPIYSYTAAWSVSLSEKWGAFIEEYASHQGGSWFHAIDTGFSYLWYKDFQWDVAFGVDLESNIKQEYVAVGFSWRTI